MMMNDKIKLINGNELPLVGLGTSARGKKFTPQEFVDSIKHALSVGYRLIDTAKLYNNEHLIAKALKESKQVKRDEVFLVSKVPPDELGYDRTLKAFETSCKQLHVDYLDLYLIHFPGKAPSNRSKEATTTTDDYEKARQLRLDSWRALVKLYEEGKCKAIGVSNYMTRHLNEIVEAKLMMPMVNQCEFHCYYTNREIYDACNQMNIQFMGYCPLAKGALLNEELVKRLGEKYGKSPAQIAIKWSAQNRVLTIPASINLARIEENFKVAIPFLSANHFLSIYLKHCYF